MVHNWQISGIVFAPPSLPPYTHVAHIAQTRKLQIEELLRTKEEEGSRNESTAARLQPRGFYELQFAAADAVPREATHVTPMAGEVVGRGAYAKRWKNP